MCQRVRLKASYQVSKLLGKYCGHHKPLDVKATGNQMFVKFVADGSVEKEGFNATFSKGTIKGLIFSCWA